MHNVLRQRDIAFMLHDVLGVERFCNHPLYAGQTREDYDQILDLAEQVAVDAWEPLAARLDDEEPAFDGTTVHIIPEAQTAMNAFWEAGFQTAGFTPERGGMGLPFTVSQAISAWFNAANVSLNGYAMLSVGVGNMLVAHASEEQIDAYLPPILEGRWTGTMCLSEPHAGSGLADIRTRAEPQEDGTYRLFGSKMWISAGEHELSENIVHMVLAKIPGGPSGVKGISLFIVPKFLEDGTRNDVRLIGLNHKMGFRGTTNCALNFGDGDGAVGYLVGEAHQGLPYMFHMMNEARIGVGLGAACLGYTGYLHALDYAKERKQGRAPDDRDPDSPMIPIIEHADVKRMLLQQKSFAEGALMLVLFAASLVDVQRTGDGSEAQEAEELLDLLTPIVKSWPSEFGLRANETAIQVLGGAGYTRDYPVERLYRDNRLNHIHEGTRGVQGMDLLGRKVPQAGGVGMKRLAAEIEATARAAAARPHLADLAKSLTDAARLAGETTAAMGAAAPRVGVAAYLANATIYLDMLGHVVVAWLWVKQALAADDAMDGGGDDFLAGKITAARYFHRYELPAIRSQCDLLTAMDDTCLKAEPAIL